MFTSFERFVLLLKDLSKLTQSYLYIVNVPTSTDRGIHQVIHCILILWHDINLIFFLLLNDHGRQCWEGGYVPLKLTWVGDIYSFVRPPLNCRRLNIKFPANVLI